MVDPKKKQEQKQNRLKVYADIVQFQYWLVVERMSEEIKLRETNLKLTDSFERVKILCVIFCLIVFTLDT